MKKTLPLFLALVLTCALALSVGAVNWTAKEVAYAMNTAPSWYDEDKAVELEDWDMGDTNAHTNSAAEYPSGYLYLKADGKGDFSVPFDVDTAGTYNIGFVLMAWSKSVPRSTNFRIDDSDNIYLCYDYADEDQFSPQYVTGPTIELSAGEHTLTLSLADDFDDSAVKSLYFDKFIYAPAEGASSGAAAPAAGGIITYTEYPETTGKELVYATGDENDLSGYDEKGGIGVDLFNLAPGGEAYCLKRDTSVWYDFEVSEKTDVTFYVGYIARTGANRGLDYAVDDPNGEHRVFMDLEESDDQQWVSATFTVEPGKHSFYLYAPTGMDDDTLKSCDIYSIELYGVPSPVEEAQPEPAPAEEAAAPLPESTTPAVSAADAPAAETVSTAPQTFDFGMIAAVSAVVSLAGYAVSKKR